MVIKELHDHYIDSDGISTDSRKLKKNQIFFALSGPNFDGNQFAEQAIRSGAKLAILDNEKYKSNKKCVVVSDVLKCLQELALFHRKWLATPIIAITGTNGKTTTKELISSVLQKKYNVTFTQGNLNNHIGVPLTLLDINRETDIGVVEMGANHQNEIEQLCNIALPDFGIITNIGKAHLEGFGSFEGVIKTKSELYQFCKRNKKKIFINGNDELLISLSKGIEIISYGKSENENIHAEFVAASPYLSVQWKDYLIQTQLVGEYNFHNVLAAIAVGKHFSVNEKQIVEAISSYQPQNNRSQLTKTSKNTLIIDAYNANPSSMELSIRNFVNIKTDKRLLILGDMFELGEVAQYEHQKIIDLVISLKYEKVIFVGKNFSALGEGNYADFQFFISTEKLIDYLIQNPFSGYTVLLKASRGIRLEKVIELL